MRLTVRLKNVDESFEPAVNFIPLPDAPGPKLDFDYVKVGDDRTSQLTLVNQFDGSADFTIPMSDAMFEFGDLTNRELIFTATVFDPIWNETTNSSFLTSFYPTQYQIKFINRQSGVFKPNMLYTTHVRDRERCRSVALTFALDRRAQWRSESFPQRGIQSEHDVCPCADELRLRFTVGFRRLSYSCRCHCAASTDRTQPESIAVHVCSSERRSTPACSSSTSSRFFEAELFVNNNFVESAFIEQRSTRYRSPSQTYIQITTSTQQPRV